MILELENIFRKQFITYGWDPVVNCDIVYESKKYGLVYCIVDRETKKLIHHNNIPTMVTHVSINITKTKPVSITGGLGENIDLLKIKYLNNRIRQILIEMNYYA